VGLKSIILRTAPEFLLIRMKSRRYARLLRGLRDDEEPEFLPIPALVRPGDAVVDAGANFGVYTVLLSRLVGAGGLVHAFEPVLHTYRVLISCLARLDVANVRAYPIALSDRKGEGVMISPPYRTGGSNFYRASVVDGAAPRKEGREFRVPLRRLDDALPEDDRPVRFVKIDVEGHELPVVRGAVRLVERWKPAILAEVAGDPDAPESSAAELFRFLAGFGYEPWRTTPAGLAPRKRGDTSVNYFFLTPDHREALRAAGRLAL
jgi:FkbM family methyltransferase